MCHYQQHFTQTPKALSIQQILVLSAIVSLLKSKMLLSTPFWTTSIVILLSVYYPHFAAQI